MYSKSEHRKLAASDKKLARIIERVGPCSLVFPKSADPYPSLLRSIAYQQLTGKAAATIYARVLALFGEKVPKPELLLAMPDQKLREAGLSFSKIAAMKDLAQKKQEGQIPGARKVLTMSDEELIAELTRVRGIGPWTVQMFLIFTLGRRDVLPASDYGVRKGFAQV
jgi:DNA-3-methyladenine glycosylase II